MSGFFFVLINPSTTEDEEQSDSSISREILNQSSSDIDKIDEAIDDTENEDATLFSGMNPNVKRFVGVFLACFCGILYAFTFTPALYVQDRYENASQNAFDYVFSLYTGIFMTSITYFSIYCIFKKNKPVIYPEVILPAIVAGWIRAI